ncbi:MAG: hypothetical protein OEL89_04885 [Candidatus Peregrinibacteria bacterium]|nr:hypothetical protein [Candidatus Peregrinibacteria bacterium]
MKNEKKLKSSQNNLSANLQNSKEGAAHFEMIISLMFFAGLVIFLFMTLSPKDTTTLPNAVIAGLYDSFEKEVFTNLSSIFIKANYTGPNTCFYIILPEDLFTYKVSDGNSHVTKLDGQDINSSIMGNNLNIEKDGIFFKVAISPELEKEETAGCEVLNNYTIGTLTERRVVSYSSLEKMEDKYFDNYKALKNELRIPPIFDFAITTETLPIKMEPQHGVPASIEITAKDYILEVLKSDGNLTNERFTLKLW